MMLLVRFLLTFLLTTVALALPLIRRENPDNPENGVVAQRILQGTLAVALPVTGMVSYHLGAHGERRKRMPKNHSGLKWFNYLRFGAELERCEADKLKEVRDAASLLDQALAIKMKSGTEHSRSGDRPMIWERCRSYSRKNRSIDVVWCPRCSSKSGG